ncbi:cyclic nucleotide-binding domain-containing protein [Nannocystis sp. SCPEA4]|uniref:Crp/Fnr family transcriptional regulator n=1 Tax=Nannocystis sp. SCPEA4 TaxID=2996787 RepID=UPI002270159E|nr:cyclic nucleotide-binding domain-containing protein [Nannocystis sp. SCPEA4]
MEALFAALARIQAFAGVPEEELRASLPQWRVLSLKDERLLWKQGRPADELALVHAGSLDVIVNGTVIGKVGVGELIGETAIFLSGAVRMATLRASRPTQVLALPSAALQQLRAAGSPVYDALLRHALVTAAGRCRELDRQIAQVRQGNFAVPLAPEKAGFFSRLWQRVRQPPVTAIACPPLEELLAQHPVLAHSSEAVRAALVAAFTPRPFRRGDVVCRQGAEDDQVYVLAAGKADVMREIEASGSALLLARFEPGTIFGVFAFASGGPRTASIVATEDGWAYAMDGAAYRALAPEAQTLWMEAMLAVLLGQCRAADLALHAAIHAFATQHPALLPSMSDVPNVAGAWGALEGLRPGDDVMRVRAGKARRR